MYLTNSMLYFHYLQCPSPDFCTAPDPSNPVDECPTVGKPCGSSGEFCCRDSCQRNYCTAKGASYQSLAQVVLGDENVMNASSTLMTKNLVVAVVAMITMCLAF